MLNNGKSVSYGAHSTAEEDELGMYNFCHSAFKSVAESDCICTDGYEVKNLVTSEKMFNNGFLAEYFVKAPVDVKLQFSCRIEIKCVVIWPQVNSQMSTGIEIHTLSGKENSDESNYRFLSKASNLNGKYIVFSVDNERSSLRLPKYLSGNNFSYFSFISRHYKDVNAVKLKIFKASYVPAIKKIEIWGKPIMPMNRELRSAIQKMIGEYSKLKTDILKEPEVKSERSEAGGEKKGNETIDTSNVPDDFLDEITYEIMTLPMILPSGKVIDQTTLDRIKKEQELLNKLPHDPFTGVPFTRDKKPKVSGALKCRIDKFLLANADERDVKHLPRRVGESSANSNVNRYGVSALIIKKNNSEVSSSDKVNSLTVARLEKRTLEEESAVDYGDSKKTKSKFSFQEENLDNVLQKTLINLPSFLSKKPAPKKATVCNKCSGENKDLYVLPCKHFICRLCILSNISDSSNKCRLCNDIYKSSEVSKIHEINRV